VAWLDRGDRTREAQTGPTEARLLVACGALVAGY